MSRHSVEATVAHFVSCSGWAGSRPGRRPPYERQLNEAGKKRFDWSADGVPVRLGRLTDTGNINARFIIAIGSSMTTDTTKDDSWMKMI